MSEQKTTWQWEITPQSSWLGTSIRELRGYKDLIFQMVRRNFMLYYQQTLLGPLWMLINPLLTVLVYMLIFSNLMKVPTQGMPAFLFFLSGVTLWTLFYDVLTGNSNILSTNAHVFSKVYFPRIIVPLSTVLLHLLRFAIQFSILLVVLFIYHFRGEVTMAFPRILLVIPVIITMAAIAVGAGMIFTVITAKYRDMSNVIGLGTRLLMFLSPVFYPTTIIPDKYKLIAYINPLSPLFEQFRFALVGSGNVSPALIGYSIFVGIILLVAGMLLFNKKSDELLDVV